jgi:sugar phosphate permease
MNLVILAILLFFIGITISCQFLAFPATLAIAPSEIGATASGFVNAITVFGSAILIPLIGKAMDLSKSNSGDHTAYSSQDYKNGMILIPASVALAIIILRFVKDQRRKNSPKL